MTKISILLLLRRVWSFCRRHAFGRIWNLKFICPVK